MNEGWHNGLQDLKDIEADEKNVIDEATHDESAAPQIYMISSYGADYDVDGFVKRLNRGDTLLPAFQRDYVWSISDASRFVESLLLGLPVPGVFLAREPTSNKTLVIDGQQRLKTLQFFYAGTFNPKPSQKTQRVFRLVNVQPPYEGKTYDELDERDKIRLSDSIIHATIIKQDSPANDDTSIYHVFERLNTGGRKLTPQEIRSAMYHGPFIDLLGDLNKLQSWRKIFARESSRLKDQELILRFLSLYFDCEHYVKPMSEFLTRFCKKFQDTPGQFGVVAREIFEKTIRIVHEALGDRAFRPERALNAAVFDAVMVGVARRISAGAADLSRPAVRSAYDRLLNNTDFKGAMSRATSDPTSVERRLELAKAEFASV